MTKHQVCQSDASAETQGTLALECLLSWSQMCVLLPASRSNSMDLYKSAADLYRTLWNVEMLFDQTKSNCKPIFPFQLLLLLWIAYQVSDFHKVHLIYIFYFRPVRTEEPMWGEEEDFSEHDYYNSIPGKEPPVGGLVDSRLRPSGALLGHIHTQPQSKTAAQVGVFAWVWKPGPFKSSSGVKIIIWHFHLFSYFLGSLLQSNVLVQYTLVYFSILYSIPYALGYVCFS